MVLKNNEVDLNLVLKFKVKIFDHTVLATSDNLMRLKCGQEGHFARFFFFSSSDESATELMNYSQPQEQEDSPTGYSFERSTSLS